MLFPTLFPFLLTSGEADTTQYDLINVYGDLQIDEMEFDNAELNDAILLEHGETTRPEFGINTILLMPFENNLDAGNFPTNDKPVTDWRILRRVFGTTQFYEIGMIVNNNVNIFYDTSSASNVRYEYAIQSVSNGTRGNAVITEAIGTEGEILEAIEVSYFGWKLSSIDYNPDIPTGTVYSFIVGNETENIPTNLARTEYTSSYAVFPKVEYGNAKYRTGGFTTIPYNCNAGVISFGGKNQRDALEAFLTNGEPKILKNGEGLVIVCDIYDVSIKYLDELSNADYTQPYTVSFQFMEIASESEVV